MLALGLSQAARGVLARLVTVVAVLAGITIAHGIQCSAAMAAPMPATARVTAYDATTMIPSPGTAGHRGHLAATDALGHRDHAPAAASPAIVEHSRLTAPQAVRAAHSVPDDPGPSGLLGTCLALIMGVAAIGLVLRPTWRRIPRPAVGSRPVMSARRVAPRPPSLEELCLLRT